jgi:hypothetical protein
MSENPSYFYFCRKNLTDDEAFIKFLKGSSEEIKGLLYRHEQDIQNIFLDKGARQELEMLCNKFTLEWDFSSGEIEVKIVEDYLKKRLEELK